MSLRYGVPTIIPATIGMRSLVGVSGDYPLSWGNYFDFAPQAQAEDLQSIMFASIRCLNFWAENLEEAKKRFLPDNKVRVILYTGEPNIESYVVATGKHTISHKPQWAIVDDERIPRDWYYNKLCFTGGRRPPAHFAEEIYKYLGDPNNEFEQYTDPKSYWAKRGATYHENGWVSYTYGKEST